MAAVKNKNSYWFKNPAGIGWKCLTCGRCNSMKLQLCTKCNEKRRKPNEPEAIL